jgi:hypothetical protein
MSSSIPNKTDNAHITVRSRDNICYRKVISIKYSECVSVALDILHEKRMCHITLSSESCLAVP